ncbi:MAG TPA: hypothetical protein PLU64_08935 [Saprospiraceae bacterium]|nr:hypothetical protein [Saprospiraceae bacterium]
MANKHHQNESWKSKAIAAAASVAAVVAAIRWLLVQLARKAMGA